MTCWESAVVGSGRKENVRRCRVGGRSKIRRSLLRLGKKFGLHLVLLWSLKMFKQRVS